MVCSVCGAPFPGRCPCGNCQPASPKPTGRPSAVPSMPPSNPTEVNFVFLGQMSKTSKASKAKQQQIKPYQVDKMKEKVYQKVLPVLQHIAGPKPTELVAVDITREATRKLMDAGFQDDDLVRRSMCRML